MHWNSWVLCLIRVLLYELPYSWKHMVESIFQAHVRTFVFLDRIIVCNIHTREKIQTWLCGSSIWWRGDH
jgi:hypothetical protein